MSEVPLYPLRFEPIYKEKVWGGRVLEKLGRELPGGADTPIGESWELVDLASTSTSGGGGGEERSVVAEGPLAGRTLHDLIEVYGGRLLGRLGLSAEGGFPLLAKYLDAGENLSMQVHPSAAYAAAHPEVHLKSEAWYIVEAQPGAAIYKGVCEGVTPEEYRRAIESGEDDRVIELMIRVPVAAGDCHYLPSGTCHALGGGILVAEVQTPSDTTFRVYDWGRTSRELHVDQALECIKFGPPDVTRSEQRSHVAGIFTTVTRLVTCEHFRMEKVRMSEGYSQEIPYDQPAVWMVLEGKGWIEKEGGWGEGYERVGFERGQTLLIPAGLDDARVLLEADTVWLETTFPKAMAEQIA